MRAAIITMCAVLCASLAACGISLYLHSTLLDDMEGLCSEAISMVRSSDAEGAVDEANKMLGIFKEQQLALELVASHNDVHDVHAYLSDVLVALECEDLDDAYQSLVRLKGALEHLREQETFSLANIL